MATWNIQGLNTKRGDVFQEIDKIKLAETKTKENISKRGVSIVVHQILQKRIKEREEVVERML